METMEQKNERNARVQARYDDLMSEGRHGHYETMFRVVREEVEGARAAERERIAAHFDDRDRGPDGKPLGIGFYDPHEPAAIIRALGPSVGIEPHLPAPEDR